MIRRTLHILGECIACACVFAIPYLFALFAYAFGAGPN